MAIKTKYTIEIEIDDQKFELIVKDPTKSQREELSKQLDKHNELFEEYNTLSKRVGRLKERYDMIKGGSDTDAYMKILDELDAKEDELRVMSKKITKSNDAIESAVRSRIEMTVSGDRDALLEACDSKGISYRRIMDEIVKTVAEHSGNN